MIATGIAASTEASGMTPEEAVAKAKEGRANFIQVVNEIEMIAPNFSNESEFFPFFLILDDLNEISRDYDLETWGYNPVAALAEELTRSGAKWIRFSRIDWELLKSYLEWSNSNVRVDVLGFQGMALSQATEKEELMNWLEVTNKSYDLMIELEEEANVVVNYSGFQSQVVKKIFARQTQFSGEEMASVIASVKSLGAIGEVARAIEDQLYYTRDIGKLRAMLTWATALGKNVNDFPYILPSYLEDAPGQVAATIILYLLDNGSQPRPSEVQSISNILKLSQMTKMTRSLVQLKIRNLKPRQIDFLWSYFSNVYRSYLEAVTGGEIEQFKDFYTELAVAKKLSGGNFEGQYRIRTDSGRTGGFTIANSGASNFVVGMKLPFRNGSLHSIDYPLQFLSYNFSTEKFEAHRYKTTSPEYGIPAGPNYFISFDLLVEGDDVQVIGQFTNGQGVVSFSGSRATTFTEFSERPEQIENPTAIFKGRIRGSSQGSAKLTISKVGSQISGILFMNNQNLRIDLPYGSYDERNNKFYLMSGPVSLGTNWIQLRGQINGNKITAEYIIGGRGATFKFNGRNTGELAVE